MVHVFTMNGHHIAVDGNSGSIHILDDISCQILMDMQELIPLEDIVERFGKRYPKAEIAEAYSEIALLKEKELLIQAAKMDMPSSENFY